MGTFRGYVGEDVSADTGEITVLAAPLVGGFNLPKGFQENIVTLRLRMKTHTPEEPYAGGQMLATVRWNDGNSVQEWNLALNTSQSWDPILEVYNPNYAEQGLEIWFDSSRDVTIQVTPLVPGGSVDVLLDYVEL